MNYINKGKRDILLFPKFENIDKIQKIREKYDELYNILPPHITLAFPFFNSITNIELEEQLKIILKDINAFNIKCSGISLKKDNRINKYYIFLNINEGKEIINNIHNKIYKSLLTEENVIDYEPHITLGTVDSDDVDIDLKDIFESTIESIYVESIGENEESIIEFEISLK